MSAYIVSKRHIDAIISAELTRRVDYPLSWFHNGQRHTLDRTTADAVGGMLWQENVESVATRYPNDKPGEWPGPCGLTMVEVMAYKWEPTMTGGRFPSPRYIQPIEALKALDGYEYQACEHEEWEASEAKAFCDAMRHNLIRRLPGYDDAPWSWD